MARWFISLVSVAGFAVLISLAQAAQKPIVAIKTKAVEISVTYDETIAAKTELAANIAGDHVGFECPATRFDQLLIYLERLLRIGLSHIID